jgi:hypothetical protein
MKKELPLKRAKKMVKGVNMNFGEVQPLHASCTIAIRTAPG